MYLRGLTMTKPSEEQAEVIACDGSAVVSARPGCGKTFTMARMIAKAVGELASYQGVIAISYTRKASDELKGRCAQLGVMTGSSFFGTIDGFCLGMIVQQFAAHVVGRKVEVKVADDDCFALDSPLKERWTERDEDRWGLVREALGAGELPISALSEVAYCMVKHVPAVRTFLRARYTAVFIDEYQDCDLAQHMLFQELVGLGIRGVAFGDMDQAIFAYDGRSPAFLGELIESPGFKAFSITENRRCHKSIVDYSLTLLSNSVSESPCEDKRVFIAKVAGDESDISAAICSHVDAIGKRFAVASRNEFALIARSKSTLERLEGLLSIPTKRILPTKFDQGSSRPRAFFRDLLAFLYTEGYAGDFIERYISPELRHRDSLEAKDLVQRLMDTPDDSWGKCWDVFCRLKRLCLACPDDPDVWIDLEEVLSDINLLRGGFRPAGKDEVNLLTYHKSKGLEFDVVFCLECYEYIMPPYRYEQKAYDAYRESLNMHYVGLTRARKACYIPLADFRHNSKGKIFDAVPSRFLHRPGLKELRCEIQW